MTVMGRLLALNRKGQQLHSRPDGRLPVTRATLIYLSLLPQLLVADLQDCIISEAMHGGPVLEGSLPDRTAEADCSVALG